MKKRFISMVATLAAVVALASACPAVSGAAQTWKPQKPISLIVSFAAGGGADIACRQLAAYVEKYLGGTIVIQNVAGGGGSIGLQQLIQAKPDGYAIAYISSSKTNNNLMLKGVTATIDDYTPIVKFASDPHLIVASKSLGVKTFEELIAKVKAEPGKITFGLGGAWGSHEFLRIVLEKEFGIQFKRMVYSSGNLAVGGVATGDCMVSAPFYTEGITHVESNNVIPLAITSRERFSLLPDVPTVAEISKSDFSWYMWRGIVGPAKMPENVLAALSDAFEKACNDPEYKAAALKLGILADFQNQKDFAKFFKEDHEHYKQMIESQNFTTAK